jgi:hypothetical protein
LTCGISALITAASQQLLACILGTVLALACGVGAVAVVVGETKSSERKQDAGQAELARWQVAMAKWEALYYCFRDDVVFFPDSPAAIPAAAMWTVL